jgi:transaldolase
MPISGLERRAQRNEDLRNVRSVASFFLSRIDVLVDQKLDELTPSQPQAKGLRGNVAIASAKLAYKMYKEIFANDRFRRLEPLGARTQWLLWGSTSTKSKEYSDVKYVEPSIGAETINTMPMETIAAYRDHGAPAPRSGEELSAAEEVMQELAKAGIDIDEVTGELENEGVETFVKPFEKLIQELVRKISPVPASCTRVQ